MTGQPATEIRPFWIPLPNLPRKPSADQQIARVLWALVATVLVLIAGYPIGVLLLAWSR